MPGEPAIAPSDVAGTLEPRLALTDVYGLVADDFQAVNSLIPRQLTSDVNLVEEIGQYIVESGGKRLRPLMVLLGTRCLGHNGHHQVCLATVIEFLHTATLLHDDVVDHSALRRGRATANATWGNAPSVLVGDFLYSRAFQLMVELDSLPIMAILSDATNTIAEGEVLQLANVGNCEVSEAEVQSEPTQRFHLRRAAVCQHASDLKGRADQRDPLGRSFDHFHCLFAGRPVI